MLRHAFAVTAFLALSGCGSLGTVAEAAGGSISSVAPDTVNAAKRALTAAHEVHRTTADFLTIAAQTNLCHSACAVKAKGLLDASEAYLVAGDKLVALSDAPGIEAKVAAATALLSQINSLIGH